MNKLKQIIKDKLGEKKTEKLKKTIGIARIIKNIVCWVLVAVLTLAIIMFMVTKVRGETPSLFGYTLNRIASGSMEPELMINDVIISKMVTDTSEISVGDIITFQGDSRFDNQKVTHRVLVTPYNYGKGGVVLVTKGDANSLDDGEINFSDVQSKFISKSTFLKGIYNFFFSKWGLILFIFLLLLIFFDEILNIVKLIISGREEEEPEKLSQVIERLQREQEENLEQKESLEQNELPVGDTDANESEQIVSGEITVPQKNDDTDLEKNSQKTDPDKNAEPRKINNTKKDKNTDNKKTSPDKKKTSNNRPNPPKKKKKKSKKKRK